MQNQIVQSSLFIVVMKIWEHLDPPCKVIESRLQLPQVVRGSCIENYISVIRQANVEGTREFICVMQLWCFIVDITLDRELNLLHVANKLEANQHQS